MDVFRFSDYDCIGFDLDGTIIHYNIPNVVHIAYQVFTDFLVNRKGYEPEYFKEPFTNEDVDFLQKGLIIDCEKGNIVKLTREGNIESASHGTKLLRAEEIEKFYLNREWKLGREFSEDPLTLCRSSNLKLKPLLNCVDVTAGLIFAKIVDSLDKKYGKDLNQYKVWPDISDAFDHFFNREQLFYSELKANPSKYLHKCNSQVLAWIKEIRKKKKAFLITGSNPHIFELTTGYAFDEDLKSLFDIIICHGQKPNFFTENRPFYSLKFNYEDAVVTGHELKVGEIYNRGNWKELLEFFSRITNVKSPRCLYIGDHLLQDIYAPNKFTNCDTLVVSDEHLAEKILHHDLSHNHESAINSDTWGSFFSLKTTDGFEDSFWNYIIKKHSKICVPNLEIFCTKPLDESIKCFKQETDDQELHGFYPDKPSTLSIDNRF